MQNLFEGFETVSLEKWKQQIEKDLKGITFDQLSHTDDNGLTIFPVYKEENSAYRGTPIFTHTNWDISSLVNVNGNSSEANKTALRDLNYGSESLVFPLTEEVDPAALLKDVSAEHIKLNFVFPMDTGSFADKFLTVIAEKKWNANEIKGSLVFDPINALVRGDHENIDSKWKKWKQLAEHKLCAETSLTPYAVDGFHYHNTGCTAVSELAFIISHFNELLHFISENKMNPGNKDFYIVVCSSPNFFETVSKIRALRQLATFLAKQYGFVNRIFIQVANGFINKTVRDAHNNLLRSTVEGMGAIAGGADSVLIFPYDFVAESKDANARRYAVNQLMIFKEESLLNKVADTGSGSFFIEEYTNQLAEKAWKEFQSIEKEGGFIIYALSGKLKTRVEAEAEKLKSEILSGKKILIGVNKFRNEKEKPSNRSFLPPATEKGLNWLIAEEIIEQQLSATEKQNA